VKSADRVSQTLIPRWRTGEVHVPVAQSFALEEVARAYEFFAQPGKFGQGRVCKSKSNHR